MALAAASPSNRKGTPALRWLREEAQIRRGGHQERGPARHQIARARHDPQQAQARQRVAAQGVLARPVGARRQQEAHGDGGNEAPQHLVRVPEHAAHDARDAGRRMHPQPHGRQRPEAARQIQRTEPHFGESAPLGAGLPGGRSGFVDGQQRRHGGLSD
ncbi:hypothetical protein G6F65_021813 [Rhizopus arrhizus]|nr:hypothetical protein G6F65_021813 [Rhizopus arrhizus]